MEKNLPKSIFVCYIEALAISSSFIRSAPGLAFPMECSETFCAPWTAPVGSPVPGYKHRLWTQPVLTAVSKTLLTNGLIVQHTFEMCPQTGKGISQSTRLKVHLKFVTWPFPHQHFPGNCFSSSSAISLLSVLIEEGLTLPGGNPGKMQFQCITACSSSETSFSLWRYSPAPPKHSRLKRNLEFISKTTGNFLIAREFVCKWK